LAYSHLTFLRYLTHGKLGRSLSVAKETGITEAATEAAGRFIKEVLKGNGEAEAALAAPVQSILAVRGGAGVEETKNVIGQLNFAKSVAVEGSDPLVAMTQLPWVRSNRGRLR